MCLLEAAAYLAGGPHTDEPVCVSPVLAAFGRSLNDGLFSDNLDELAPYAARLVDTVNPAMEQRRMFAIVDWALRNIAASALQDAGLTEHAAILRALPEIGPATVRAATIKAASVIANAGTCGTGAEIATTAAYHAALTTDVHAAIADAAIAADRAAKNRGNSVAIRVSALALLDRLIDMAVPS
jgi:hypothetical protein